MKRFPWRKHRDEIAAMLTAGATGADVARAFGQQPQNTYAAIARLGLAIDPDVTLKARRRSTRILNTDPAVRARRSRTMRKVMSAPERIEAARQHMQRIRAEGGAAYTRMLIDAGRTPEAMQARKEGARRRIERDFLGWCPQAFRDQYRFLRLRKGFRAAEARAMIEPLIREWLQTFAGKLWLVETGRARIERKVPIRRSADSVLTASSLAECGF